MQDVVQSSAVKVQGVDGSGVLLVYMVRTGSPAQWRLLRQLVSITWIWFYHLQMDLHIEPAN